MISTEMPEKISYAAAPDAAEELVRQTLGASEALALDMTRHLAKSKGKNFRARLLLAAASDADGVVPRDAVTAAAALELLHLATLVHDDVIDNAETRRGLPSVKSLFGNKSAVICGDYLFCQCFLLTAEMSAKFQDRFHDVARIMSKICLGELRQFQHNNDTALGVKEYFKIIAGKTSALFAFSLYSGALIGGYEETEARRLGRFGHDIGMIFQLTDDCMDYVSDGGIVKKTVRHDLLDGVITLPLIFAMSGKPELKELVGNGLPAGELGRVISDVIELGGVKRTMEVAGKYYAKAEKQLELLPEGNRRALLSGLLKQIGSRVN